MPRSVFAIVANHTQLHESMLALEASGFSRDDISVVFPDQHSSRSLAHEQHSKAPEGAVAGGLAGAGVGGVIGLLAGIGSLVVPGLGVLIAAGPLLAALSGAAVGVATGGLVGGLIGLGIPEYEAKRYESHLLAGGILVSVHADNHEWAERAKAIFVRQGATDIASTREQSAKAEDARRVRILQKAREATVRIVKGRHDDAAKAASVDADATSDPL